MVGSLAQEARVGLGPWLLEVKSMSLRLPYIPSKFQQKNKSQNLSSVADQQPDIWTCLVELLTEIPFPFSELRELRGKGVFLECY